MTLEDKIRDVLARLATLSEAPASRPSDMATAADLPKDQRTGRDRFSKQAKKHHGSKIPAGVRLSRTDPDRPPDKERSLADFYAWHFARNAGNPHRLLTFYLLAERDYMTRRYHVPDRMALRSGGLTENNAIDGGAAEQAAADRVIDLYEGVPAVEVAVHEYTTEAWVQKARKLHKRNPYDGRPRPQFLDWKDDERRRQIERLRSHAKAEDRVIGAKLIADHFGVSKQTIQRYLEPVAVAVA